jgi:hypothetical protein
MAERWVPAAVPGQSEDDVLAFGYVMRRVRHRVRQIAARMTRLQAKQSCGYS